MLIAVCVILAGIAGCNKKSYPEKSTDPAVANSTKTPVKKIVTPVPKVIVVEDRVAQKTVDGRLYYDLNKKDTGKITKTGNTICSINPCIMMIHLAAEKTGDHFLHSAYWFPVI